MNGEKARRGLLLVLKGVRAVSERDKLVKVGPNAGKGRPQYPAS